MDQEWEYELIVMTGQREKHFMAWVYTSDSEHVTVRGLDPGLVVFYGGDQIAFRPDGTGRLAGSDLADSRGWGISTEDADAALAEMGYQRVGQWVRYRAGEYMTCVNYAPASREEN